MPVEAIQGVMIPLLGTTLGSACVLFMRRELRSSVQRALIGFVSGMYVANESMMTAAQESISKYSLEDGHFELNDKADASLLSAIASGEKADVKSCYTDKARAELDGKFEDEFKVEFSKKL